MRNLLFQHFLKLGDKSKTDISYGNSSVYEVFALHKQFA